MSRVEPMIAVRDVEASSLWYQRLLACRSDHGGREFDRLVDGDSLLLLLHHWGAPEHPSLLDPTSAPVGHGLILYFRVDDLDAAWRRARTLGGDVVEPPHVNPKAHHREFTLRDPDGYHVSVCGAAR